MQFSDALVKRHALEQSALVGYTAGVFDLFHHGHQSYLEACSRRCLHLFVGVDVDALVREKKGQHRPIESEQVRLARVLETTLVEIAFFKDRSAEGILPLLRPHVYFIPSNREVTTERLSLASALGVEVTRVPYTLGVSTSALFRDDRGVQ